MTDWYFYQDHGKTVGPLDEDELRTRIREGRVRVYDLIYREGESAWRLALEHSALRGEFKSAVLSSLRDKPWVCLQRKNPDGNDFKTTGPYSQQEIRERLQSGDISYSDYAWKDKFYEWKRIGSLEEFNPRARNEALHPVPPVSEDTSTDLLKDVVEMRRNSPPKDWIPQEAGGDNLAGTFSGYLMPPTEEDVAARALQKSKKTDVKPTAPAASTTGRTSATPPPVPATPPPRSPHTEKLEPEKESKPLLDWGLVAVLALVLIGSVLIISRFVQVKPTTLPETQTYVEPPPPPPPEPLKAADNSTDLALAKSRPPSEILLSVQTVNNQPHIDLRSDGTEDYPILLQVIGLAGQVSEGGGYYKLLHLTAKGSFAKPLDLSGLHLPEGHFVARAESGSVKKEVKFSWGLNDPQFKTAVNHQRKLWSGALWHERLTLFRECQAVEKQLTAASTAGGKFSVKGLENLIALKRGNPNNYLLFDDWWELHQIVSDGNQGVNGALLSRVQREHERLASLTLWK